MKEYRRIIRVLMFCSFFPPKYSGAARQAISLAKHLKQYGVYVEFATIRDPGLPIFDVYDGFSLYRIEAKGRRNEEMPLWANFIRFAWNSRMRFDVLHCHGISNVNDIVGPVAKLVGWRSLVKATMSNELIFLRQSSFRSIHRLFLGMVDAYVATSNDLVDEFRDYRFNSGKVHHIPNGVDTGRFYPAESSVKSDLREKFRLPKDRRILLSVGVFDHRKNIGWLIREWVKTKGFDGGAFLLAIGPQSIYDKDGSFLDGLKDVASENDNDIRIINYVDNIEEYYRASDIFVLCSTNEGLPNVLLEAIASGLPCIATRSKGNRDIIVEGETGYFFNLNSGEDFREKLSFLSDPCIAKMSKRARSVALEKFDLNKISGIYFKLYESLIR